jgi:predicted dehydrogenase
MIRIAFIGGAAHWHARSFASLINEHDREAWAKADMPRYDRAPLPGAQVVAIWDPDREEAQRLAGLAGIPKVLSDADSALGCADAVMILDDISMTHQRRARPFLAAGLPTFIDKPLSPDPEEAADLIALAERSGAPMMSCSALRYAKELAAARERISAIGEIVCATATGPNELVFYGIHPLELAHAVMGPGVAWVQNVGDEQRALVRCAYPDGRSIMLQVLGKAQTGFQMSLFGADGSVDVRVEDSGHFYQTMIAAFVRMVESREMPIPLGTTLEIITILAAAKRSQQQNGARVTIAGGAH